MGSSNDPLLLLKSKAVNNQTLYRSSIFCDQYPCGIRSPLIVDFTLAVITLINLEITTSRSENPISV